MINVAIVEDDNAAAKLLSDMLLDYQIAGGEKFNVVRFNDAVSFLTNYRQVYDIIFMDIEMPGMSGMDAAFKLRESDRKVILIFVTNMAQFAVKGYEVDAMDYLLKPVNYQNFSLKLKKAVNILKAGESGEIVITQASGIIRIPAKDVLYVEVLGHKLIYHTQAENFSGYGSLSELEEKLKDYRFMRCNNCYLVNPKYIMSVQGFTVSMRNGDRLQISHPRKKEFMAGLADWLGQGNFI